MLLFTVSNLEWNIQNNNIMQVTIQKAAWYSQVLRATASFRYSTLILLLFQNVAAVSYLSKTSQYKLSGIQLGTDYS